MENVPTEGRGRDVEDRSDGGNRRAGGGHKGRAEPLACGGPDSRSLADPMEFPPVMVTGRIDGGHLTFGPERMSRRLDDP